MKIWCVHDRLRSIHAVFSSAEKAENFGQQLASKLIEKYPAISSYELYKDYYIMSFEVDPDFKEWWETFD